MKKLIGKMLTIIMIFMMFAITGCSKSAINRDQPRHVSIPSVIEEIKRKVEIRPTQVVEANLVSEKFYLNMNDIEDHIIETELENSEIETIAIVKAKNGKVDSVREAFKKVIEDKRTNAYYPGQSEAVEEAEIQVVGNYVGLFIIPDYEGSLKNNTKEAVDIFLNALK